jgi:hypothetical protein
VSLSCAPTCLSFARDIHRVSLKRVSDTEGQSEYENLIALVRPFCELIHASKRNPIEELFGPDPAGLGTRASGGYRAATCKQT